MRKYDTPPKITDHLHIIWTIARKDISDAFQNKLVLSLALSVAFMLLMPKFMGLIIEPPYWTVLVYDPGESALAAAMDEDEKFNLKEVESAEILIHGVGSMGLSLGVEFGLSLPENIDQLAGEGQQISIDGFMAWPSRFKVRNIKEELEQRLATTAGVPVLVDFEGHTIYPSPDATFALGMVTWIPVIIILMIGINLIPHLFFEEKQTQTLKALLVSPADEWQIVLGKALAGVFYILITALIVFIISWNQVVHWEITILFVLFSSLFTVALGLVFGSFYDRQGEATGLSLLVLLALISAIFIQMLNLDIPKFILAILPWVPSSALADMMQFAYLEKIDWVKVWLDLGSTTVFSALLYALVIWKIRGMDR